MILGNPGDLKEKGYYSSEIILQRIEYSREGLRFYHTIQIWEFSSVATQLRRRIYHRISDNIGKAFAVANFQLTLNYRPKSNNENRTFCAWSFGFCPGNTLGR